MNTEHKYKLNMNANELADYITKNVAQAVHGSATAATMLRQQQAEIEALKEKLNEAIDAEKDRRFE